MLHALNERRPPPFRAYDVQRETADGALRAGGHHHPVAAAARDHCTGVQHVQAIGNRRAGLAGPVGVLRHGQRLAREQGLVDLESVRGNETDVRRDPVAGFEVHDVARHERLGIDVEHPLAAAHGRADTQQLLQGLAGPLGTRLLHGADDGVDEQHAEYEGGVLCLADQQRHRRGNGEQVDQGAPELPQQDLEEARRLAPRQRVWAEALETGGGFFVTQAVGHRAKTLQHVRKVHREPVAVVDFRRGTHAALRVAADYP